MTLTAKPYQIEGSAFLASRRAAVLGDDAGLGKSMQIIRAADFLPAARVLVICPAIGRVSWRSEFPKWQNIPRHVLFLPNGTNKIPTGPVAVIVTYDYLSRKGNAGKVFEAMRKSGEPFDLLVLDEAQALKEMASNRTKVVYGKTMLEQIPTVWVASATLRPNNASELYTHIRALFPEVFVELFGRSSVGYHDFRDRFCETINTPFGVQIKGDNKKTVTALYRALTPHVLMRKKKDVLKDLKPIEYFDLPFEIAPTPPGSDGAQVDEALNNTIETVLASGMSADDADDVLIKAFRNLNTEEHVASRRRELGLAKVAPALEWIKAFLDADPTRKLIVFAYHTDVIAALVKDLEATFIPTVQITGATPADHRALAVELFQMDPKFRVFVGQTQAAGTSITLTAADTVLLVEPDYVPSNNYQAISRAHRIGQHNSVQAYFAYADDTVDRRIAQIIRRKTQECEVFDRELSTPA